MSDSRPVASPEINTGRPAEGGSPEPHAAGPQSPTATFGARRVLAIAGLCLANPIRWAMMGLIRLYQWTLSPIMPNVCRFQPTCSRYFFEALQKRGLLRGTWLGVRRLLRCQPFGGSGHDPVP